MASLENARARGVGLGTLALAWVAAASASADTLRQTDWTAGPGTNSSATLDGETGFASVSGQWAFGSPGELRATDMVFEGGAGQPVILRAVETAGTAADYVGFTGCTVTLMSPARACRTMDMFLHRDTTTGQLSLVSVTDGSAQMGCAGSYEATFTASAGTTLEASDEPGEVTLVAGVGMVAHTWSAGCADGFILGLPAQGASIDGAITSRTNLQDFRVFTDVPNDASEAISLASLPNNGAAGTPVPFAFRAGLLGSLTSATFSLGAARQPLLLELDASIDGATITVFVRTGDSAATLAAAPWAGPFSAGADLTSVPPGAFLQYRLDVTLDDSMAMGPSPAATLTELRIEHEAPCPCTIDTTCYADGELNPANACERCDAASDSGAWSANDGAACDDGRFCTSGDSCLSGACVGGASPCSDGLGCTNDTCDEALDACDYVVASGCAIAFACVPSGATNPLDACELCDPVRPTQWTLAPGCAGCNDDSECMDPQLAVCDLDDHACVACSASDPSACADGAPVCDAATRSCRGCADDDECAADGSARCADDGACVRCLSHVDCAPDAPVCTADECVVCLAHVECFDRDPGMGFCDDETGRCGACLDDSMCRSAPAGGVCLTSSAGRVCGCQAEADCNSGSTCDLTRRRCVPLATADSDRDGVPDDKDADDDDDGIPDLVEGGGEDFSLDFDQDGVPNWRDPDAPRFVDANGDGTNDLSDADGDGVPNHLDLDADGDGVPDLLENAARDVLDVDRDGRLDDARDADRDGLRATVDADDGDATQRASIVPVRDTDGDGTPDYLDHDADAEGWGDAVEAGGEDADEDGRLDHFTDANMNGLADRVDPALGAAALPLPDTDRDGMWDFQDASDAPRVSVEGGGLCAASGPGATRGRTWLVLGLAFLGALLTRRRRARR